MSQPRFTATEAKNRFGQLLEAAIREPVAIEKNGRTVAYLVSAGAFEVRAPAAAFREPDPRERERRLVALAAGAESDAQAWLRLAPAEDAAGVALTLASARGFDRPRWLALARALDASMLEPERFSAWLTKRFIEPARFIAMVRAAERPPKRAP